MLCMFSQVPPVADEYSTCRVATIYWEALSLSDFPTIVGCEWSVCLIAMSCGKYLAFRAPASCCQLLGGWSASLVPLVAGDWTCLIATRSQWKACLLDSYRIMSLSNCNQWLPNTLLACMHVCCSSKPLACMTATNCGWMVSIPG